MTIGKRISELRNNSNISKQEFAQLLNITEKILYNIEHDITKPTIDNLIDISDYFKISIDKIVRGK